MAQIPLNSWTFAWLGVGFDAESGSGWVHLDPEGIRGFAYWTAGRRHALWNHGGRICFQVGVQKWYADEGWQATLEEVGSKRVFRLAKGAECVVLRRYKNPNLRWWNKLDVTRDAIDDEMTDFFLWAARRWSNKANHANLVAVWR